MSIKHTKKITIEVPIKEYRLLVQLKEETGKSLKTLVKEGLPLILLKNRDILEKRKKEVIMEAEELEDILHHLENQINDE